MAGRLHTGKLNSSLMRLRIKRHGASLVSGEVHEGAGRRGRGAHTPRGWLAMAGFHVPHACRQVFHLRRAHLRRLPRNFDTAACAAAALPPQPALALLCGAPSQDRALLADAPLREARLAFSLLLESAAGQGWPRLPFSFAPLFVAIVSRGWLYRKLVNENDGSPRLTAVVVVVV